MLNNTTTTSPKYGHKGETPESIVLSFLFSCLTNCKQVTMRTIATAVQHLKVTHTLGQSLSRNTLLGNLWVTDFSLSQLNVQSMAPSVCVLHFFRTIVQMCPLCKGQSWWAIGSNGWQWQLPLYHKSICMWTFLHTCPLAPKYLVLLFYP